MVSHGAESGPYVYGANYSLNKQYFLKNGLPRFNFLYRVPFDVFRSFAAVGAGVLWARSTEEFGFPAVIFFLVGAVVSWLAVTWLTSFLLAGAINKGIAAEQQMRDEIRRLCREALAAKEEESL